MSLFLGKIHFWLFNKILWFEGLEEELQNLAENEGLDVNIVEKYVFDRYGERVPNKNLEEIIDKNNIHGWLQERIISSEGRVAAWTSKIYNEESDSKMKQIYIDQGIKAAKEVALKGDIPLNAVDIFTKINDYILDGMPCDRVNEILVNEEDQVEWKRRICVHKDIWDKENMDVNYFYILRGLWIESFVSELNPNYEYNELDNGIMTIIRRK